MARNALDMGSQQQQIALLQQLVDQLEQGKQMLQKEKDQELQHAREVPCAASSGRATGRATGRAPGLSAVPLG